MHNRRGHRNTHLLALSFSISLLSTSSALRTSNLVLNSSASAQSRHTLFNILGPLPSLGALPHPNPNPVLSFISPKPLRSLAGLSCVEVGSSAASRSPPITPHSIASFLCFISSSWIACAISGMASPVKPISKHKVCANASGVKGESKSHSIWSIR